MTDRNELERRAREYRERTGGALPDLTKVVQKHGHDGPHGLPMNPPPVLPYGGEDDPNSGYAAGAATSEERARRDDADGTTSKRQAKTLWALGAEDGGGRGGTGREYGLTWKELADVGGWHHGQASGVLSNLHKAGKIARLTERRNRCFIYVLPEYVNSRETQEQGRPKQPDDGLTVALIQAEVTILRVEEAIAGQWCEDYTRASGDTCITLGDAQQCPVCRVRTALGRDHD